MKKLLSLLLVSVMVLSMAACGSSKEPAAESSASTAESSESAVESSEAAVEESGEVPYIGVTIFNYANNFVGYIRNGIDFYMAEQYPDVEYLMVDGENNQATQTERIDTMISKGVNVLAVNLVDPSAADTIIAKAKEADLPVVFFNKKPSDEALASYDKCWFVGLDSVNEGKLQAEMVAEAWTNDQEKWDVNGDGVLNYVYLMGELGHSDSGDRETGFMDEIVAQGTPVKELARENANWNTTMAKETMETWIAKYGTEIELVVSQNDAMALGAVEALKGNGLITDDSIVPVIGINALPEVAELIKNGTMLGSVLTSTYDSARAIVDMCVNAVEGKEIMEGIEWEMEDNGKVVRIPETRITAENVDVALADYKAAK